MSRFRHFIGGVLLATILVIALAAPASATGFSDIDGSPYEASITALASRAFIGGFADGTFGPDKQLMRQQFAKMIVNTMGLPIDGSEVCPFHDVSPGQGTDPFYPGKYVAVCAAAGITTGTSPTTFNPSGNITRQQLVTMVVRAAGDALLDPPASYQGILSYSDPTHGAKLKKAEYNGLLAGVSDLATWNPQASATRGETAEILAQLFYRTGEVLTLTGPSGTQTFTMSELEAMTATEGHGGWKNSVNNIKGFRLYKGVSISSLVALAGGGTTVTVVAADGWEFSYDAQDIAGQLHDVANHLQKVFHPTTGVEITGYTGQLTMILAYEADGAPLGSDEAPLRIGFVGPAADQVTDSRLWESQVVKIEVE